MSEFSKVVVKVLGLLFGLLLIAFTGYETFSFLYEVTGNPVVAAVGLIMFEGGFLYWSAVFKSEAEGLMQMALSLLASLADITLVVLSVGLQLGAFDVSLIDVTIPAKIVVAAVIGNLLFKYFYTLSDPNVMKNIWNRALQGYMLAKTFMSLEGKVSDVAQQMANDMAVTWYGEFQRDFFNNHEALAKRDNVGLLPGLFKKPETEVTIIELDDEVDSGTNGRTPDPYRLNGRPSTERPATADDQPPPVPAGAPAGSMWWLLNGEWRLMQPAVPINGNGKKEAWGAELEGEAKTADQTKNTQTHQQNNRPPERDPELDYTLDEFLEGAGLTRERARAAIIGMSLDTAEKAYKALDRHGYLPEGMTRPNFTRLYNELMAHTVPNGQSAPK